jgi:hypothetical protein
MMDMPTFQIAWNVTDTQWERARRAFSRERRGSLFDRYGDAFFSMFRGSLQFSVGAQLLFPPERLIEAEIRGRATLVELGDPSYPILPGLVQQGCDSDLLNFANSLMVILEHLAATPKIRSRSTWFRPNNGGTEILFGRDNDSITIETNLFPDLILRVSFVDFMAEAHRFLGDFITALNQEVPGILDWVSFDRLRTYARDHAIFPMEEEDTLPIETRAETTNILERLMSERKMRAELRYLYVLHENVFRTAEEYAPDDPSYLGVETIAGFGPAGLTGADRFEFVVCTPNWLAAQPLQQGTRWGQDHLFVEYWDSRAVHQLFQDLGSQTVGPDWTTIAMKLGHFGKWQYDDYRETT